VSGLARATGWVALGLFGLSACATLGRATNDSLPRPVLLAAGDYDNSMQFQDADPALRREPAVGHPYDWLDQQYASFRWVLAPAIGEHVMYLEWRKTEPTGPISRQRIWSFRRDADGAWRMDFYTLREPAKFSLTGADAAFARLTTADLIGYGEQCALVRDALPKGSASFSIPRTCEIVSRSGRAMSLRATVRFEGDCLRYSEAGQLPDGSYAFLVPGREGLAYEFARGRAKKCSSLSR
jgi:hypothetical protein